MDHTDHVQIKSYVPITIFRLFIFK